ncbi:MAG: mannose-1-phosphate guanylyltransferase [Candidatus Omnitrophica bacterium]|nr:mannose-1-phosphate guanylyltransferase [Candidatus Omnitrophota bacterium]
MKKNIYGVILVGGKGARLWPLSKLGESKAFVSFGGGTPLVTRTVRRLTGLIARKNILFVVDKSQRSALKRAVPALAARNILVEPCGRNTAAAVGLAAINVDPDAVLVVLPSDAYIADAGGFREVLRRGADFVGRTAGAIVCVGIRPTEPSTGYGYLRLGTSQGGGLYKIDTFIEKPPLDKARRFIRSDRYRWNAGIFIFKAETILEAFRSYSPDLYKQLGRIQKNRTVIANAYKHMKPVSIDYQIMERSRDLYCITADICWRDLGNWNSIEGLFKADRQGNSRYGRQKIMATKSSFIYNTEDGSVGVIGMDNVIVIHTKQGVLVCKKDRAEQVKELDVL